MSRLALLLALPLLAQGATQRFLLLSSANQGGPGKVPLRYAQSDARGFGRVLATLGGVEGQDIVRLEEPDTAALLAGLETLGGRIAQARAKGLRTEVVFYYSGHADENGLLLGSQRMDYRRLRQAVDAAGSDVRLAVLDACASGGALRAKGGVRRPAFLTDETQDLRGRALLTSSTAQESSHESDSLGGSFFTQALLTGLRGAADADRDGKVTLNEAYRFAYQETLRRTQEAKAGSQHPSVDMDLAGAGDVILTDLRNPAAHLHLDSALAGRLDLRDSSGALVAQVQKWPGMPLDLGLEPGPYHGTFTRGEQARRGILQARLGQELRLDDSLLSRWDTLLPEPAEAPVAAPAKPDTLPTVPINLGLMPPMDLAGEAGLKARQNFALELALAEAGAVKGFQFAGGLATSRGPVEGVQLAVGSALAEGDSLLGVQASMVSIAKGSVRGVQLGMLSIARSGFAGAQISDLANISATGSFRGVQLTAFFNSAAAGKGLQAALVNWAGDLDGTQLGLVNATTRLHGFQAGLVNVDRSFQGCVQAGLVNVFDTAQAFQAGLVNVGRSFRGAQAGLVNVTGSAQGLQLGLVNVSDSLEGVQLGLVSLSRHTRGLPVGPVTWSSSLPWRADLWMDETGNPVLSNVWEWRFLHSQSDVSWNRDPHHPVIGYGFSVGAQLPSRRWILSADLGSRTLSRGDTRHVLIHGPDGEADTTRVSVTETNELLRLRLVAGTWILPGWLGAFVGTGWTLLGTENSTGNQRYISSRTPVLLHRQGQVGWPSLFAGVRLGLRH